MIIEVDEKILAQLRIEYETGKKYSVRFSPFAERWDVLRTIFEELIQSSEQTANEGVKT